AATGRELGGVWERLPLELERFLHGGAPWSLTCADLQPIRRDFEEQDAGRAFDRLWSLARTNEPELAEFARAPEADCPHRAAAAFEVLRFCLDEPDLDPATPLHAVSHEVECHSDPAGTPLASEYERLLRSALACVRAPAAERAGAVAEFAQRCGQMLERYEREQASTAWWQCGRLFLGEVVARLRDMGCALAAHPDLITRLVPRGEAELLLAEQAGSRERLRSIAYQAAAEEWQRFLERRIDVSALA